MNLKLRVAWFMVFAFFAAEIATAQSKSKKPAAEPTVFYEGDRQFANSVPLPNNVLDALRVSEESKEMQNELEGLDRQEFAQLFSAVQIHLGGPEELDYVVLGKSPMSGADNSWFWIVLVDKTHTRIIASLSGNGFSLLKTRNNGRPNIASEWCSAAECITSIYHYNGQQYKLAHEYHKENTSP